MEPPAAVLATYLDGRLVYSAPGNGLVPADDDDEAVSWGKRETRMRDWLDRD